ncbi:MAG: tripartite tricarboxylate transporter TctB family protein [Rhizobiales bacterium]|nr:tripartite tricarboxylate transporter TctB family protein [Hyphomicrobiales bacterium]
MNDTSSASASGPSHRSVEFGMAIFTGIFALVIIAGSVQAGHRWTADGPQAGFFPFYVGLFILVASGANFFQTYTAPAQGLFAEWSQLRQVMAVVVPSVVYVTIVPWLGIYVSSMLLIAFFMRWLGRYSWPMVLAIAIGMPVATFIVFENWFLVPLPKGPIEDLLGF